MSYLGQKILHFRVVDLLAKGGMGDVYAAYDERLRRKVALKMLRPEHRPNDEVKARLRREARILSQLDHPHICRIHDLLDEADTDVLVLELIEGRSLKAALAKDELDDEHKLRVALQVAAALTAAHGQSVVHRDLKPDNVMLTPAGDVKVLDFGLSRTDKDEVLSTVAAPTRLADLADAAARKERYRQIETRLGSIMGTAAYMSPEQAQGEAATAASDVYSLGLLYQEMFTGRPPYEPESSLATLLTKVASADTFEVTGVDPDLAALIERMKSPAPAARPTTIDVGERLRWIGGKPGRRRRRRLRGLATAFLVAVALALGLLAWRVGREAERANREAERASRQAEAARQVSQFLVDLFELSDPGKARGNSVTAREILDAGAGKIASELDDQPRIQARLMDTVGSLYGKLGLYDEAVPLLEQALDGRRDLLGAEHEETADSQAHLAFLLWQQGRFDEAVPLFESSLETRRRLLGPEHPDVADSLSGLGIVYWNLGRYDDAEPLCRRALEIRERALGASHPKVATSLDNLAIVLKDQQRLDEAEPLYKRSLEVREQALGADHPDVALSLNNLGVLYLDQERYAEARPLYERALSIWERALGTEHPSVGVAIVNLGNIQLELGNLEPSRELYDRAVDIFEEALGPEHPYVGYALAGRGTILVEQARHADALAPLARSLAILEHSLGAEHVDVGRRHRELARAYQGLGDDAAAERHDRLGRRIMAAALGADHPEVTAAL